MLCAGLGEYGELALAADNGTDNADVVACEMVA